MIGRFGLAALLACGGAGSTLAQAVPDPTALPPAARRIAASAEECAVWKRERSFARSVEAHDRRAFEEHLHAGAVFNAGAPEAARGKAAVVESWIDIIEGTKLVLRWRPGLVQIGGDPAIALSRGPWIMESAGGGTPAVHVGFYQTIWARDPKDGVWRVLYDGLASTPQKVADRAAAEKWVVDQPMAECAGA